MSTTLPRPLKIGIGGPVGSGKTALTEALCLRLRDGLDMAVITNDIYTREDAEFLVRRGALPAARVVGRQTRVPRHLCPNHLRRLRVERHDADVEVVVIAE